MNDFYTEQLIKKRSDMKDVLKKVLLIAITIVSAAIVLVIPIGIIIPIIMIVVDVFVFRSLDVEYEYLYLNGDLDIDKIMHKEKRKRMFSTNVSDMEIMAPANSAELNSYKNARVYNYTSGNPEAKVYEMLIVSSGETKRLIFEPNEAIVEGIWMMAPRKVIR